jgi:hypothetical protein
VQYIPEDNSEHHTRRRENLKSHGWNTFENKVSVRIFGSEKENVARGIGNFCIMWSFLIINLPSIIRVIKSRNFKWDGCVACKEYKFVQNFIKKNLNRRGPLGRPRRRWEDNIAIDLKEIGFEGVDWI